MRPIDEVEHIRTLLRTGSMMTHEQKMGLIAQIRKNAIIDIVKIRPETVTEGHDLTLTYQAYHFISELRKHEVIQSLANLTKTEYEKIRLEKAKALGFDQTILDDLMELRARGGGEAVPPELAANLDLLEACTRTVDNRQINENAICAAYAKTDGDLITGKKFLENSGRKKGALSQKTIYINQLARMHPELSPKELYRIADKSILGKGRPLKTSTFDKKVSEARNPK